MTRARQLADLISDGVIGTTELADDAITAIKLDETGNYTVASLAVTGNVDGRDVSADGTKLDGIEAGADVTDTANVVSALTAGSDISIAANGTISYTGASDVVSDTTPQLGGNLDLNSSNITGTGNIDITGTANFTGKTTHRGGVSLLDGDVLTLGTSDDLQFVHNGSNSFITDAGTGDMYVRGNNSLFIQNQDGSQNKAQFVTGGAVNLMHNGATKLQTTSTGVTITGNITANNLFDGSYTSLSNRPSNVFRAGDQKHAVTSSNRNLGGSYVNHLNVSAFNVPAGYQAACFMSMSLSSMYESNAGGPAFRFHISGPNNWYSPEHRGGRGSFNNYTCSEGFVYFQQGFNPGNHTVYLQARTWQGSVTLNEDGGYDTLTCYWTLYAT